MHKMFKVETDKGIYCIKVLNPEVMSRSDAYNNFIISETISNLAKNNNIPVSSALEIDGNYLTKLEDTYYMVFDYIEGKTLKDDEITINHCKKIGKILAQIHNLDDKEIGLDPNITNNKNTYNWESYINNPNFNEIPYKELYLINYKKYNSILKRVNERLNTINNYQTICHRDMDPKNVMWNKDNPIIIDWESASLDNPYIELIEDALCWSGFLSNQFNEEKFTAIFKEYSKYRNINNIDWYDVICGNLIGRFNWLKYNLERSLGIISKDEEEIKLASIEVTKTIDEINRYINLIGTLDNLINKITSKEKNYNKYMDTLMRTNNLLKDKQYQACTSGFTNTIFIVDNFVIRICTSPSNEKRFINEIDFYHQNKDNIHIPKLYAYDTTKKIIPYYYEIIEKIPGQTLYDIWYKIDDSKRKEITLKIIEVVKSIHSIKTKEYDFNKYIKDKLYDLLQKTNLTQELSLLLDLCDKYFKENIFGLIHGDLHFDNFIYDNNTLKLIDFEYSMSAPIDYDFRIFTLYDSYPYLHASGNTDMKTTELDYQDFMNTIINNYNELKNIKYLKERLTIYYIIELLNNYKNTKDNEKLEIIKKKVMELK